MTIEFDRSIQNDMNQSGLDSQWIQTNESMRESVEIDVAWTLLFDSQIGLENTFSMNRHGEIVGIDTTVNHCS